MRRVALAFLAGLMLWVLPATAAGAQDDGGTAEPADGDPAADGSAGDPADEPAGDPAGDPAAEPTGDTDPADAPDPAADPGLTIVEDEIQILELDNSRRPTISLVVALPPEFDGQLAQSSFAVAEDDAPRSVRFAAKLEERLEVVLVIDTSGSMSGDPIESAKAAALNFVDRLDPETEIAVVGFGQTAEVLAPLSTDRDATRAAVSSLASDGETSLYDGLVTAAGELGSGEARRFVIVLSDGADTASTNTVADAAAAIVERDATLYAITLDTADADFSGLRALSGQVDGNLVSAADNAELDGVYDALAKRLSNLYRLDYLSQSIGPARIVVSALDAERGLVAYATMSGDVGQGGAAAQPDTPRVEPQGPTGVTTRPVEIPAPEPIVASEPGLLSSANALWIGAAALFAAMALVGFQVFSMQSNSPSVLQRLDFSSAAPRRGGLASFTDRASSVAESVLERRAQRGKLDAALEKAGVDMRPGEYVLTTIGVGIGGAAVGFIVYGLIGSLAGVGVGLLGSRFRLARKGSKRQKRFGNQLGDTLLMIAGSLRAGHGVLEAIDTVASQAESPTAEEFSRVIAETRIGRDLNESLYDVANRMESQDFIWVVRAIAINRELGGDLAEVLDNVGETIRDRNRLRDQVRALSAEGRVSAYILFGLPLIVAAWVRMTNPEYMASMTDQTSGKIVVGFAAFLMVIGGMWLKKLVAVEY